jgi:phosphatidylserine/phosphatidylglycerophosphate/cardiolipin synthase-like enzyme
MILSDGNKIVTVANRVNFNNADSPIAQISSEVSPFKRFSWTDHGMPVGTQVKYRVTPIFANGKPQTATDWSNPVAITASAGSGFSAYFNRGLLMSQFMSGYLKEKHEQPADLKQQFAEGTQAEQQMKTFLGGAIRKQLLDLLDEAIKNKLEIYAALYELSDPELLLRLKQLKGRAHVLLANGTHSTKTPDENALQRAQLEREQVDVHDRMIKTGLAHNKFMIICDDSGEPARVWTGSTNWTPTGLCTQVNNALLIDNKNVAKIFHQHWQQLADAGTVTPKALISSNDIVNSCSVAKSDVDVWFTRTSDFQEMDAVNELISSAKQGILFLMFEPGKSTMVDSIIAAQVKNPNLYVHGVISTMEKDQTDTAHVSLVQRGDMTVKDLEIVQPEGIQANVAHWQSEVTRNKFLATVGYAIVHSKVIVIDPFGDNPIVVTGSHNFSASASSKNDENLVIIRDNAELAKAYAVNIKSVYDHFRFRAFVAEHEFSGNDSLMNPDFDWQASTFSDDGQREQDFWCS